MAAPKAFNKRDARELDNRFDRWIVEFNDGFTLDANNSMNFGKINDTVDLAISYASERMEANHGRFEIKFNVYGATWREDESFLTGSYVKDELVYSW